MSRRRLAFLVVTVLLWGGTALAYWTGSTPTDGIELKEGPGSAFRTIRTLPKGTTFNAIDRPQQGYYRIRTSRDSGWVDASQLAGAKRYRPSQQSRSESRRPRRSHRRSPHAGGYASYDASDGSSFKRFAVTPLINYDLYTPTDLNNLINANDFNNGLTYGGEFQYFLNPELALGVRIEYLSKSVLGSDQTTQNNFQFAIKSTSITVGAEYFFLQKKHFALGVGGYAGLAPTSFTSTDTTLNQANSTELSATTFTFLGLLDGSYSFNDTFAATLEAGYRYLKTSELQPTVTGSAPNIFVNSSGYAINLSGAIIGIGGRISF